MNKKLFTALFLIVVVLFGPTSSYSQKSGDPVDVALRQKAFDLLESLAGQLGTLQSAENRARLGSNIAGSLWPHNENRARELFAAVQQDINTGLDAAQSGDNDDTHALMVFMRLRSDTVERIAKYDPEFAYQFFKATELNPAKKPSKEISAAQDAIEAQLAKQIARNSPDVALQIGRKLLARGFPDDLNTVLVRLNRRHKEQGRRLYKDVVRKLGEVDLSKDWREMYFAMNLAGALQPPDIDEPSYRELLGVFTQAAAANGCAKKTDLEDRRAGVCRNLASMLPLIAKFDPSGTAQLKPWAGNSDPYNPGYRGYVELNELAQDGTVEEMLALQSKYPTMQREIRWQAFQRAYSDRDFDRARKMANEAIDNPDLQRQMLARLDRKEQREPITDEHVAAMRSRLAEITAPQRKADFLLRYSVQISDRNPAEALKLLNQAYDTIETFQPGKDRLMYQIGMAWVYCDQKSDRGLAIMESLMPQLNELIEASVKLDGFDRRYLRDGEWNMSAEGSVGEILTRLANDAGYFAWCDFDRAVSISGQFERPEIRIMAQLKLAQGILAGRKRIETAF